MPGVSAPVNWSTDAITLITVLRWSLDFESLGYVEGFRFQKQNPG